MAFTPVQLVEDATCCCRQLECGVCLAHTTPRYLYFYLDDPDPDSCDNCEDHTGLYKVENEGTIEDLEWLPNDCCYWYRNYEKELCHDDHNPLLIQTCLDTKMIDGVLTVYLNQPVFTYGSIVSDSMGDVYDDVILGPYPLDCDSWGPLGPFETNLAFLIEHCKYKMYVAPVPFGLPI